MEFDTSCNSQLVDNSPDQILQVNMEHTPLKKQVVECLDVGGTKILAALMHNGRIRVKHQVPTSCDGKLEDLLKQITEISKQLRRELGEDEEIGCVSVGVPGPVRDGMLFGSKPLRIHNTVPIRSMLEKIFKLPVHVENDVTMATYAELHHGAGRKSNNFCLLALSTGIGVGVVIDGRVLERRKEMGHVLVEYREDHAAPCMEHAGCWVSQTSGRAIAERYGLGHENEQMIFDALKKEEIDEIRLYNARGLGILISAYDPDKIVVMGSLGLNQYEAIIPSDSEIARHTILRPVPPIEKSHLGNDVGVIGCYCAAKLDA